jgi:hypothetical protein
MTTTAKLTVKLKVFQGPNGWYAAIEDRNGSHRQCPWGGTYSTAAAALRAARAKYAAVRGLIDSDTAEFIGFATEEQAEASDAAGPEGHIRIDADGHVVVSGGRRVHVEAE